MLYVAPVGTTTNLNNLHIDNETIAKLQRWLLFRYSIEKLINHMLKKQLRTLAYRRSGFILVNKQTLKDITEQVSDEVLINAPNALA